MYESFRYVNTTPSESSQATLSLVKKQEPSNPLPFDPNLQTMPSLRDVVPPDEGNYVSLGWRQNYAELAFSTSSPAMQHQLSRHQQQHAMRQVPGSADSTLAHIPPPMAALSLSKLKSVLSSCPQQQPTEKDEEEVGALGSRTGTLSAAVTRSSDSTNASNSSRSAINRLYDMNLSCCATAYEYLADVRITFCIGTSVIVFN